jgi:small subunit ribosomal protein S16
MLVIRMQRTGRKGHAMFRLVVQDSRQTPSSGKVVAQLGHYDPHNKELVIDKDKATKFLSDGAQPSNRAALLMKKEGIKLPSWVKLDEPLQKSTKNLEKLRKNRPAEEKTEEVAEDKPAEQESADKPDEEAEGKDVPEDSKEEAK